MYIYVGYELKLRPSIPAAMKTIFSFFLSLLIITGCNNIARITEDQATKIIESFNGYHQILDYDIFCSDPEYAGRLLNLSFEEEGLVSIRKTLKMVEVGSPLIAFTEKADPYLLQTPEELKESNIQRVKLGEIVIKEVTQISIDDKTARVDYITTLAEPTPFLWSVIQTKEVAFFSNTVNGNGRL